MIAALTSFSKTQVEIFQQRGKQRTFAVRFVYCPSSRAERWIYVLAVMRQNAIIALPVRSNDEHGDH